MGAQPSFDLTQLDADSPELHLIVDATGDIDTVVGSVLSALADVDG